MTEETRPRISLPIEVETAYLRDTVFGTLIEEVALMLLHDTLPVVLCWYDSHCVYLQDWLCFQVSLCKIQAVALADCMRAPYSTSVYPVWSCYRDIYRYICINIVLVSCTITAVDARFSRLTTCTTINGNRVKLNRK